MADNTIDSLVLEISSNSKGAEKALDKLAVSLQRMSDSLGGMNTAKLMYISKGIREMSASLAGFSANVKMADFNRVSNGLNKIAAIDAGRVRATAVSMNGLMKSLNNLTFLNFDSKGIAEVANGIAKLGRGTVTQASKNIPLLTESLKGLANGIQGLKINFDIGGLEQLTTVLQKLGSKTATKAAEQNIVALGNALKELMTTLSRVPVVSQNVIQMTNALAQLASTGGKAGTASRNIVGSFNALPASASKTRKSFSGLAGAIGKFYATYWLFLRAMGGFKKAINISSDLTEVQNVVDVTFGEMADTMNDFAASALKNYGMSKLMAKQIASRFQAMGVAMGFTQSKMTEMSVELTKLTGDMASFYNESQQSVAKALQSIFTGETEPLRRFGLDLSFATVEAWALAQGIEADMQKMTQSEKTMLRYQYVLANTGAASGDFLRTINSWHNQIVLLMGGFQQLGSIVGGVLINAFKPFIQALNSVMGAVINFAQVVSDALGAIFGWEYQTGGGVAQDLEMGAGAAQDIEDATGGAADNAKKLNKYIAGWHEVNNMSSDDKNKGSGGGSAGGLGNLAEADGGKWLQKESLWEKYTSSIDSLYQLGEYIGETLTKAMDSIDWNKVYSSAINFGTGLASFLNGLISPDLFGATGRTIAGALNTAIYAALSFGRTFDWSDFGNSIASGVNNFFFTFDFGALANTIDAWVQGICTTIKSAVKKIEWKTVWNGIKEFISELDLGTVGVIIGALTIKSIGKIMLSASILKIIQTAIGRKISESIIKGISFAGIGKFLANKFPTNTIIQTITTTMAETGASLPTVLFNLIVVPLKTFFSTTLPGFITSGFTAVGSAIGLSGTAAIAGGGALVVGATAAVIAGIVAVVTNWDEIKTFFGEKLPAWWNETAIPFFESIPNKLGEIWENVKTYAAEKWGQFLDVMRNVPEKVGTVVTSIGNWFGHLPEKIGSALGFALGKITQWVIDSYEYLKAKIPELITSVGNWFIEMKDKIGKSINKVITETLPKWKNDVISFFREKVPEIINKVVDFFGDIKDKMLDVGENIVLGLWNGINNMVGWIGDKISGFVQGIIKGFKDGFDEHSPSKISYEIGDFWSIGLGNGMVDGFDDIYRQVDKFTTNITDMNVPLPKINTEIPKPDIKPTSYDLGKFKSTMNMEMDAKMAQYSFEMKQLREEMYGIKGILAEMNNKGLIFDDTMMERKFKSASNKYFNRTGEQLGLA